MSKNTEWLDDIFPNLRAWHDKDGNLHTIEKAKQQILQAIKDKIGENYDCDSEDGLIRIHEEGHNCEKNNLLESLGIPEE